MTEQSESKHWKVGELAELAHVTVRQLHHYDEIGLLVPSHRSPAGYRLYTEPDVQRLYQILLYRGLGFTLDVIAELIDNGAGRAAALRAQRELLLEKRQRMDAVIRAVDRALNAIERGSTMTADELNDGFDAFANAPEDVREHEARYHDEVEQQWGDTDAYRESMRRAKDHSRMDWQAIQAENEANEARMAELLLAGADPEGEEARATAEAMRRHIDRWFYPCSVLMHAGLADMYESDERFRGHYEQRAAGLAAFVAAAIRANARNTI